MERIKVVARFADGRVVKGYTQDFHPNKPRFHFLPIDAESSGKPVEVLVKELKLIEVSVEELKALFFVADFTGNPEYNELKEFTEGNRNHGRKIEVTFADGEVMVGTTMGYDPRRPSFFLFPADPKSNNQKVFVVSSAVTKVRYL
ncbi:MAG TPA: hypothetical protein VHT73_11305 [Thermodesulfobacteriota bacterium]|nr:hypothetical protein [Thermodesulfobacteriota bacterium]